MMRPFLKRIENVLDRVLGLLGGLVCAFVASLAAFYFCAIFGCHFLWFVGASAISVLCFSLLGLVLHRFFARFFIPVFNGLANEDGHARDDDEYSWNEWIACVGLFIALIALFVGSLFRIHIAFAVGAILFVGYAIFAPKVFRERKRES